MSIYLQPMTKELARTYFSGFRYDPILFPDMTKFRPYVYDPDKVDAMVDRFRQQGRVHFAIMLQDAPIGEVILKKIDPEQRHCTLSIHMRSDAFKNRGYGTQAEILTLKYAFTHLGMDTVYADALVQNTRSQHVLEKVGFQKTHADDVFVYYRCHRRAWMADHT